jgi:hypothetical protein
MHGLTLLSLLPPPLAGKKGDSSANSLLPYLVSLSTLPLLLIPPLPSPPGAHAAAGPGRPLWGEPGPWLPG